MQWFPTCVLLQRTALDDIVREATASADGRETGGILLGTDPALMPTGLSPTNGVRVRHAGDPGPAAERRAAFFRRDYAHAQRLALDAFDHDGSQWIGEWHTHPSGQRRPSRLDRHVYRRHLADEALGLTRFTAVIVTPRLGVAGPDWTRPRLTAWTITRHWTEKAPILLGPIRGKR